MKLTRVDITLKFLKVLTPDEIDRAFCDVHDLLFEQHGEVVTSGKSSEWIDETDEEARRAIEEVLRAWTPGTFANGYEMADWLKKKAEELHGQTSDAQSTWTMEQGPRL